MRKALMSLLVAATVMTPIAAEAQRRDRGQSEENAARYERLRQQNQERYGNREQRQQARPERQAQPAPAPVQVAQNDDRRGGDRRRGGDGRRGERGDRGGNRDQTPSGYQRGWQGPNTPEYRRDADRYNQRAQENAIRYGTPAQRRDAIRDARRDDRRDWRGDRRDDRRDWRGDRRGWNNGWRNDRRYDWRGWRNSNRNIYRLGRYYAPYNGWSYRRFSVGLFLQPLFYSRNYWIGDPWQYRLPAAPYGAQWIRYYDDVLLVDTYTGEVIDVIYNFFW